jgi:DNA repair protein RadC
VRRGGRGTDIWRLVQQQRADWMRERLLVVALDERQRVVGTGELPLTELTPVRLRGVLEAMHLTQPVTFIAVHQQARASRQPSPGDSLIAKQLRHAADEVGMPLVDHFLFSHGRYHSIFARGRLS